MLRTTLGSRSDGGPAGSTPNPWMPLASCSPRSRPTWPNVVLHDWTNPSASEPPQRSPPKFFKALVVSGSGSWVRNGNRLLTSTLSPSAVDAVTVLNVDPGG